MYNDFPASIKNDFMGNLDWFSKKIDQMSKSVVKSSFGRIHHYVRDVEALKDKWY